MDQFWKVIVTSSALSTVLSLCVTAARDTYKTKRSSKAEAQNVALTLEDYAKRCGQAITHAENLLEKSYQDRGHNPINGLQVPQLALPTLDATKISFDLVERVRNFPSFVANKGGELDTQWNDGYEDEFEFNSRVQEHIAEVGQKSFDLAKVMRIKYGLPLELAAEECKSALEIFEKTSKAKSKAEKISLDSMKQVDKTLRPISQ